MRLSSLSILCLALPALLAGGCSSSSRTNDSNGNTSRAGFTLEASTYDLVVGETVTVFARSYDTFGRDPKISWTTTGGRLVTEQNGRVARVMIDQPGTFTIRAILSADGREIQRESIEVRVKPLS